MKYILRWEENDRLLHRIRRYRIEKLEWGQACRLRRLLASEMPGEDISSEILSDTGCIVLK